MKRKGKTIALNENMEFYVVGSRIVSQTPEHIFEAGHPLEKCRYVTGLDENGRSHIIPLEIPDNKLLEFDFALKHAGRAHVIYNAWKGASE